MVLAKVAVMRYECKPRTGTDPGEARPDRGKGAWATRTLMWRLAEKAETPHESKPDR
jgi:hypothetical protein